jgi:signal transduction histidine kinase
MIAVLGVYAVAVFTFVSRNLEDSLDQQLGTDFQFALAAVAPQPDGSFTCQLCEELEFNEATMAFERGQGSLWLQVWNPGGDLLYSSAEAYRLPIFDSQILAMLPADQNGITVSMAAQGPMRVLTQQVPIALTIGDETQVVTAVVQVALPSTTVGQQLADFRLILLLGLPLSVAVAGLGGYTLARRALTPIDQMAERARLITADRLHDRLPIRNPDDEMGRLAIVFNETLGRLEASFDRMHQFTADVSHELRTPLTAIQSVGEVGLRESRDETSYRRIIGSMLEEVDRLSGLIGQLLTLSRVETEISETMTDEVDLLRLVEDVAAHLGVLAEERQQMIEIKGATTLRCLGDRIGLRQALINLVHNAIKFSPVGGRIQIGIARLGERVLIEVIDTGSGVPEAMWSSLFDRFYRGDLSTGGVVGTGLGLSIAKRAIEVNNGYLSLEKTGPEGTTFRISLPAMKPLVQSVS